jgi:4-hydroxybenzoate polyprenyltransferase
MKLFKLILWGLVIVIAVLLGFSIIGFVYSALWYLFWIGVIALGGYIGYKILKKGSNLELEGRDKVSKIELENAKIVKSLEDYKHKYQSK